MRRRRDHAGEDAADWLDRPACAAAFSAAVLRGFDTAAAGAAGGGAVRRLFRWKTPPSSADQEMSPSGVAAHGGEWEERLASVGRALEATGRELREVAVATSGPDVLVSALSWIADRYHDRWLAVTLVVDPEVFRSPADAPLRRDRAGVEGWADRLGAVGALLDRDPLPLRDACVLQLAGGFVVEALVPDPKTGEWVLTSRGFATQAGGPG